MKVNYLVPVLCVFRLTREYWINNAMCFKTLLSSVSVPEQAAVKSYICLERNNFICIWHDAENREPTWEPDVIEQIESGEFVYGGRSEHIVNAHIEVNQWNEYSKLKKKSVDIQINKASLL